MIKYKKALDILKKNKIKIKFENINSVSSINRISGQNVFSPTNYPAADNTALDGFAINSNESNKSSKSNTIKLKILKTLAAGKNPNIKKITKFS